MTDLALKACKDEMTDLNCTNQNVDKLEYLRLQPQRALNQKAFVQSGN